MASTKTGCQVDGCTKSVIGSAFVTWLPGWDIAVRVRSETPMCQDHLRHWNAAGLGGIPAAPKAKSRFRVVSPSTVQELLTAAEAHGNPDLYATIAEALGLDEEDSSHVFTRSTDEHDEDTSA